MANKVGAENFGKDETTIIQTFAAQLSVCLENTKLYEQLTDQTDRLKQLSQRLMEVRENEQRHIARELHDEIGQGLTALKIHLQTAQRFVQVPECAAQIEQSLQITEGTLKQVRKLSLDLRPSILDDLGLVPALRWLLDRQSAVMGIVPQLIHDTLQIDPSADVRTACYRVVQESLTNVAKYAGATSVSVRLLQNAEALLLEISDDGQGFIESKARNRARTGASLGILGMQERVSLVGGVFEIHSQPGCGTTVKATFKR